MAKREHWDDRPPKIPFFGLNAELLLRTFLTLLPIGILQAWTSYSEGLWVAGYASFFERGFVKFLGQIRLIPDLTIILAGAIPLTVLLFKTFSKLKPVKIVHGESAWEKLGVKL